MTAWAMIGIEATSSKILIKYAEVLIHNIMYNTATSCKCSMEFSSILLFIYYRVVVAVAVAVVVLSFFSKLISSLIIKQFNYSTNIFVEVGNGSPSCTYDSSSLVIHRTRQFLDDSTR